MSTGEKQNGMMEQSSAKAENPAFESETQVQVQTLPLT